MSTTPLDGTGLDSAGLDTTPLDSLTLGLAQLGNLFEEMTDADSHALLETAWECGLRSFDTAPHYGLGLSESRFGAFLRRLSPSDRASARISTKVGRLLRDNPAGVGLTDVANLFVVPATTKRVWDASVAGIRASCTESLERLGVDRVETLYLHDPDAHPDPSRSLETGMAGLAQLRAEGLVTRIGIGSMSDEALELAAEHEATDELMVAGRHTLIDHSAAARLLPLCAANGVSVAAAAVFNSGILATPTPGRLFDYGPASEELVGTARRIADICGAYGTDLPTAALHYPLRHPSVRSVVVGAMTPGQVRENVDRMLRLPTDELWKALETEALIPQLEVAS